MLTMIISNVIENLNRWQKGKQSELNNCLQKGKKIRLNFFIFLIYSM